jgi:hypothetical protein
MGTAPRLQRRTDVTTLTSTSAPVVVESESVSHVTGTDARLEAKIDPESQRRVALYQFQMVTNTNEYFSTFVCPAGWGSSSICLGLDDEVEGLPTGVTGAGEEGQAVSLDLARAGINLKPGTTYHYRVIAATDVFTEDTTDWEGPTVAGSDQTFTTRGTIEPVVSELEPASGSTSGRTRITIQGIYLENTLGGSVYFGSVKGRIVEEECDGMCEIEPYTTLVVESPPHEAGTVDVTVENDDGYVSAINPGDQFTYVSSAGGHEPTSVPPSFPGSPWIVPSPPKTMHESKPLTRARKLAAALKLCAHKPKKRRASCERQAHKRYGAVIRPAKQGRK